MNDLERARLRNLLARVNALPLQNMPTAADQLRQINSIGEKMLDADNAKLARTPTVTLDVRVPVPPPPPAVSHGERVGDRLGNLGEGS